MTRPHPLPLSVHGADAGGCAYTTAGTSRERFDRERESARNAVLVFASFLCGSIMGVVCASWSATFATLSTLLTPFQNSALREAIRVYHWMKIDLMKKAANRKARRRESEDPREGRAVCCFVLR